MESPTITIIIPVYNVENYVNETLLSIKNQISQPNEVIVIDDGSTDASFNILDNFRDLQGWKIIQTPNQGLGLTRNFGRSIAKSEYIYFLDSDDIINNDLIYQMRKIIHQYNKPDVILFSGVCFDDKETNNKKPNLKFTLQGEYFRDSRYITKVELWSKNKLSYPKGIAEDEAVFFPLLALSESTVVIPEIYYKYRLGRPGSITLGEPNAEHASDFLNRINFSMEFMTLKYDLIRADLSAWRYSLARKGLNYISICLKTKTPIAWITVFILFYRAKSLTLPFKLLWRFLRYFLKVFSNINIKKNDY